MQPFLRWAMDVWQEFKREVLGEVVFRSWSGIRGSSCFCVQMWLVESFYIQHLRVNLFLVINYCICLVLPNMTVHYLYQRVKTVSGCLVLKTCKSCAVWRPVLRELRPWGVVLSNLVLSWATKAAHRSIRCGCLDVGCLAYKHLKTKRNFQYFISLNFCIV